MPRVGLSLWNCFISYIFFFCYLISAWRCRLVTLITNARNEINWNMNGKKRKTFRIGCTVHVLLHILLHKKMGNLKAYYTCSGEIDRICEFSIASWKVFNSLVLYVIWFNFMVKLKQTNDLILFITTGIY